jgi:hypothetical protein
LNEGGTAIRIGERTQKNPMSTTFHPIDIAPGSRTALYTLAVVIWGIVIPLELALGLV